MDVLEKNDGHYGEVYWDIHFNALLKALNEKATFLPIMTWPVCVCVGTEEDVLVCVYLLEIFFQKCFCYTSSREVWNSM